MAKLTLTLITGRSTRQGTGVSTGKAHHNYKEATTVIELSGTDMSRTGLSDGDQARLKTEFGTAEVRCRQGDVPEGLAFIAFGPACNRLIGGETSASGMPDSKHLTIELERVGESNFSEGIKGKRGQGTKRGAYNDNGSNPDV
jgi:formylmethanofuran dehydrogenase subunit D